MNIKIKKILENNVKVNKNIVDGYILYCNKHLGKDVLRNKYNTLKEYFDKLENGSMDKYNIDNEYINNDDKCYNFKIVLHGSNKTLLTNIK